MREQAPLKAPQKAKNSENGNIWILALMTWKKVVLEQFSETGLHLKSCWDKLRAITEKYGYPWGLWGLKIAQKWPKTSIMPQSRSISSLFCPFLHQYRSIKVNQGQSRSIKVNQNFTYCELCVSPKLAKLTEVWWMFGWMDGRTYWQTDLWTYHIWL